MMLFFGAEGGIDVRTLRSERLVLPGQDGAEDPQKSELICTANLFAVSVWRAH